MSDTGKIIALAKAVAGGSSAEIEAEVNELKSQIHQVTPEQFGAVGDGVTDDSQAVQDAVDAGYAVYFASNKTYYLGSTVTIDHDCHLFGGENTVIKTATQSGVSGHSAINVAGTLKKTTTLTSDYVVNGSGNNTGNMLTLTDMTGIEIGDIIVVQATDQYFSPIRPNYYLGATLLVVDVYDGHIYVNMSIPWGIENTANVSVKVYSSTTPIIENINFISDLNNRALATYVLSLEYTKNAIVRNCSFAEACFQFKLYCSVNALIDSIEMAHSKSDNTITGDGYGLRIESCTNTIVQRVITMSGQHGIVFSGGVPVIDTVIRSCEISAECRVPGINEHDIAFRTIVEDCTFGGISISGNTTVNRCRIINNKRNADNYHGIIINGTEDSSIANVTISNCVLDGDLSITLNSPAPQDPIHAINAVIGNLLIENCTGGMLRCEPTTNANVLSNKVKKLVIRNWKGCDYITHKATMPIEYLEVVDCEFNREDRWIYENSNSVSDMFEGLIYCNRMSHNPMYNRLFVDLQKTGNKYYGLPENIPIAFSSSDSSAHYMVCGKNLASNDPDDYTVGSLSSSVGSAITWTDDSHYNNTVTVNASGNLVYTMPSSYNNMRYIRLKCIPVVNECSVLKMSCKLKNTGETDGAGFRFYGIVINEKTGLVTSRFITSATVIATSSGSELSYSSAEVTAGHIILLALYNIGNVANSSTTIEDFVVKIIPKDLASNETLYEVYNGSSRDGNGTLYSVEGVNNVLSTASAFHAKFRADINV